MMLDCTSNLNHYEGRKAMVIPEDPKMVCFRKNCGNQIVTLKGKNIIYTPNLKLKDRNYMPEHAQSQACSVCHTVKLLLI